MGFVCEHLPIFTCINIVVVHVRDSKGYMVTPLLVFFNKAFFVASAELEEMQGQLYPYQKISSHLLIRGAGFCGKSSGLLARKHYVEEMGCLCNKSSSTYCQH